VISDSIKVPHGSSDAVALPNGKTAVGWLYSAASYNDDNIAYRILDNSYNLDSPIISVSSVSTASLPRKFCPLVDQR